QARRFRSSHIPGVSRLCPLRIELVSCGGPEICPTSRISDWHLYLSVARPTNPQTTTTLRQNQWRVPVCCSALVVSRHTRHPLATREHLESALVSASVNPCAKQSGASESEARAAVRWGASVERISANLPVSIVIADLRRLCLPPRRGKEKISPGQRSAATAA